MGKIKTSKGDYLVEFVRYYKLLPALWNTKRQDYHNKDVRLKAYLLLLRKLRESEPRATLHDVRAKVNTLRSNYRRHLKKVGTTDVETSFQWWNEMHFINGNEEVESAIDIDASYSELKNDPSFDENAELTGKRTLKTGDYLVEFIRYYKLLPALWNTKSQDYYNRDVKLKAYLLLLRKYRESEPRATLHDVKAKVNDLRSNYRRHLKKVGTTEAEANFYWWKEMHFINGNEEVDSEIDVDASYAELKNDPSFDEEAELNGKGTLKSRDYLVEFIRFYKHLPALWDMKCQDYYNREMKSKAYLLLLRKYRESKPRATLRDVKAKINDLRSNYRRYLKKEGTEAEANIYWLNEMQFISGNEEVGSQIDIDASYSELKTDPSFDEEAELQGHRQGLDESEMTGIKMGIGAFKSRDHLVEFIRYYKLLPALWNTNCRDYHKRDVRVKSYMLLLRKYRESQPRASLHDVKAKVNAMRSNYRRHLKKGGLTKEDAHFYWWNEMHFINCNEEVENEIDVYASYEELKNDLSFEEEVELSGHPQHVDEFECDSEYDEWEREPSPESESDPISESEPTPTNSYTRINSDNPTPKLIYSNELLDEDMSSNSHIDDEYHCWGKVMVTELKRMSPIQQIFAKKAITEILMEGQLGLLHKDSVQINKSNDWHSVWINRTEGATELGTQHIYKTPDTKVENANPDE